MPLTTDSLEDLGSKYDQIIIYGAKGWLGQSSADALQFNGHHNSINKFLLVGSRTERVPYKSHEIQIYSAKDSLPLTGKNVLFLNFAFLRKEKLMSMKQSDYISRNFEAMEFPKILLSRNSVKTFVNISSGVADFTRTLLDQNTLELYSILKRMDEIWTKELCQFSQTKLINCRLYSMSGKYINEFDNLALSLFIKEAIASQKIVVHSPNTLRTFIDGANLIEVLVSLALEDIDIDIDSGGVLTTLGNLANQIAERFEGIPVVLSEAETKSPDYVGDYLRFNEIASDLKITLKNLSEQINETLKAFTL